MYFKSHENRLGDFFPRLLQMENLDKMENLQLCLWQDRVPTIFHGSNVKAI